MTERVIKEIKSKIRKMKKEDYIVLLLVGVLLVIISLPSEKSTRRENISDELIKESSLESEKTPETAGNAGKEQKAGENAEISYDSACYDLDSYVENLEKRVEGMLSGMEGAGKVKVMITVADCGKEVVEKDREGSTSDLEETDDTGGRRKNLENQSSEEVIYQRDAEGNEVPYVVQRKLPEVTGVVVAAQGAGNRTVKENIIEAVEVLFNLSEHKIKVIKMIS